jgi:hypothetical protein
MYITVLGNADYVIRMFSGGEKRDASEPIGNIHKMPS